MGQSTIRINNYWDNTYYLNPSAINTDYEAEFSVVARKQWLGFPGSPDTFFATGTTYINKINTQFGLKVFVDKLGYNTISNINLSYAHSVTLNHDWTLNMGLAGSFQCLSYDKSQVNMMTTDDPALYENLLQQDNFNADLGIELIDKSWKFGFSSQNLFTLFFEENRTQVNTNYLYAMYRKKTEHPIDLQYGACAILYNGLYQMEFNITSFFKFQQESDVFQFGLFYRTKTEMGVILGFNFNENMHLAYSYDFNVSGISRSSIGTHELMLVYKLNKYPFKPYRY
jgi:type IX secretion system PorP/SprF family membrane protein